MRTPVAIIAAIVLSISVIHSISARLVYDWSYQELFDKSDFVVIAKPLTQTRDANERSTLQDIQQDVVGVISEFQTLAVFKGNKRDRFILHHYRLPKSNIAIVNGPSLINFKPLQSHQTYLLFLLRERDGRFAPIAGQTDLDLSVQECGRRAKCLNECASHPERSEGSLKRSLITQRT